MKEAMDLLLDCYSHSSDPEKLDISKRGLAGVQNIHTEI